jgi:hypothetical protein
MTLSLTTGSVLLARVEVKDSQTGWAVNVGPATQFSVVDNSFSNLLPMGGSTPILMEQSRCSRSVVQDSSLSATSILCQSSSVALVMFTAKTLSSTRATVSRYLETSSSPNQFRFSEA